MLLLVLIHQKTLFLLLLLCVSARERVYYAIRYANMLFFWYAMSSKLKHITTEINFVDDKYHLLHTHVLFVIYKLK